MTFNQKMMNRSQGSTLILALLIVTVVSVMAFGGGQLYVSEVRIVNTLEAATGAYYAAESAIEEGLQAFRTNRKFQRCEAQGPKAQDQDCIASDPNRKGRDETIGLATVNWKATYLDRLAGDLNGDGEIQLNDFPANITQAKVVIKNNESRLFDVTRVVKNADGSPLNGDLDLYFKYYNCTGQGVSANDRCVNVKYGRSNLEGPGGPVMEIRLIFASPDEPMVSQLVDGVLDGTTWTEKALYRGFGGVKNVQGGAVFTSDHVFRIDGLLQKITENQNAAFNSADIEALEIKTFGADLALALKPTSVDSLIDSSITTIEALGSIGDSKRKFVLRIDRQHGALISVNDYTLFGEEGVDFELLPD